MDILHPLGHFFLFRRRNCLSSAVIFNSVIPYAVVQCSPISRRRPRTLPPPRPREAFVRSWYPIAVSTLFFALNAFYAVLPHERPLVGMSEAFVRSIGATHFGHLLVSLWTSAFLFAPPRAPNVIWRGGHFSVWISVSFPTESVL